MTTLRHSRTRWFLIFWIFILGAIAFLDRVNISIAGSSIAAEYHLSNVQLGYVFSAFLIGYALFQTPGGRLADRVGPRRVMAVAVVWWGIFTVLTASLPTQVRAALWILIAVRFSLGAGEAVMYPASNQFVAKWIPTQERGIANGWIFAGVGTGSAIAPPLITYIMVHYGWRTSFWISAAIGIVAGAVWYLIARDTPRQHPWVSASELTHIQSGLTIDPALINSGAAPAVPWPAILRSKDVLAVTLSYFSYGYMSWIFFSWFFIYLSKVRGMSLKDSASFTMLPFLAMAIGSPLGGLISDALTRRMDKWRGRCVFSCVVMALAAAFLILGAYVPGARWASVALALGAGALYMSQSCYWSVTADIAGPSSGAVSGLMNMGAQLGGAVTASLTPAIAGRYGWTTSFLVAAALCTAGALAWLAVDPTRTISPQRHRDTETQRNKILKKNNLCGSKESMMTEQDPLTARVIGAAIEVHRGLGPGLLESTYEECLCHELNLAELTFKRQVPLPVVYKGVRLDCGYRLDVVVEGKVLLELKTVERLLPIHEAQLLTYLRLAQIHTGLLLNFNVPVLREGIKRMVL